ncbi:group-specific protein [Paenibacillus stellifer]|uniref:Group-specific protein n=1 Tax=Paenibacillus stellifer TaxID=169760 RepID=A0A089LQW5_9BACL|nr:group-specific protein [Paenibacillus stellifer]AIQ63292.1 group-specific protein [Paenibacillus stellifer]
MRLCRERIEQVTKEIDAEFVFWDTRELMRRTCLSWNTIQSLFFFDSRFPKHKVGGKWLFPARETRQFLETWLSEQPK